VTSTPTSVHPSSRDAAGSLAGGVATWANLASVYIIWGSTYLAIRVMVRTVPPLYGAGSRFMVAGVLMLAFLGRRRALRVTRRELLACAAVGTLLAAGGNGLVTVGEQDVPSGLAAVLIASVPLWIVVFRAAARDRVPPVTLLGVLGGFAGVAILLLPGNRPAGVPLLPSLVILGAGASWGFGSFISGSLPLPRDGLVTTGWQMLFGGFVLVVSGAIAGEHIGTPSGESAWAWAYLVVVGALVAYTSYTWLLRNAPISKVSTYAYVNPVVAVILGALILGEDVGPITVLGTAVIVASVAAIVRPAST
jgi:drug/metabolite transporter (DMT)-like permease